MQNFSIGLAVLLIAGAIALGVVSLAAVGTTTRTACSGVNILRNQLVVILQRSEQSLPSISYYKTHPTDLATAEAQDAYAIEKLQQVGC